MGCDIHIVIQREETPGNWREIVYQTEPYGNKKPVDGFPVAPAPFMNRNYDLFGLLADVRNGSGFAGIVTGDGWSSIAPDRGLPEGFDEEAVAPDPTRPKGPRSLGDHSFTWVTLDELKAFPWDSTVTQLYGCVKASEYEALVAVGETPTQYSGGIFGPDTHVYSPHDYALAKDFGELVKEPYVRMSWPETARSATHDWPGTVIPWLDSLAEGRALRLILGFDS